MVFVYYCVMYALCYHVLPLLIFYFIVLHYNVLYVIVLYFLMCCTYYYLFKNITQGLSGTLTETIFVYLHICLFVFCVFVFACQITGNIYKEHLIEDDILNNVYTIVFFMYLCICVFVYLCICIFVFSHHILGNIIFEFLVPSPFQKYQKYRTFCAYLQH